MLYQIQIDTLHYHGFEGDWHTVGSTSSKWAAMRLAENICDALNDKDNAFRVAVRVLENKWPNEIIPKEIVEFVSAKENTNDELRPENIE